MNDTHPEVEKVWIELLRQAGPERRAKQASQLTNQSRWRTRQAIARLHSARSEREREFLLLEYQYGREIAMRVRWHLGQRSQHDAR